MNTDISNSAQDQTARTDETDQERRDALRKMGAFAAYTAPATLVMLHSEKAVAADGLLPV